MSEAPPAEQPPPETPPAEPSQEDAELKDLQSDMALAMADLITGQELRHSINPAVTDFTNAAGVDPTELQTILVQWHNQGLVYNKIPNDGFAQDGVQYRYKLNHNGFLAARGGQSAPAATLTSISPTTGQGGTTVTVTATGTNFDSRSYIQIQTTEAISVHETAFDSDTQLHADVDLPTVLANTDVQVTVASPTWGTTTDPQTFTMTP